MVRRLVDQSENGVRGSGGETSFEVLLDETEQNEGVGLDELLPSLGHCTPGSLFCH